MVFIRERGKAGVYIVLRLCRPGTCMRVYMNAFIVDSSQIMQLHMEDLYRLQRKYVNNIIVNS